MLVLGVPLPESKRVGRYNPGKFVRFQMPSVHLAHRCRQGAIWMLENDHLNGASLRSALEMDSEAISVD